MLSFKLNKKKTKQNLIILKNFKDEDYNKMTVTRHKKSLIFQKYSVNPDVIKLVSLNYKAITR